MPILTVDALPVEDEELVVAGKDVLAVEIGEELLVVVSELDVRVVVAVFMAVKA